MSIFREEEAREMLRKIGEVLESGKTEGQVNLKGDTIKYKVKIDLDAYANYLIENSEDGNEIATEEGCKEVVARHLYDIADYSFLWRIKDGVFYTLEMACNDSVCELYDDEYVSCVLAEKLIEDAKEWLNGEYGTYTNKSSGLDLTYYMMSGCSHYAKDISEKIGSSDLVANSWVEDSTVIYIEFK